ncbi:MAG TPA: hypothetical protein VF316_14765 [Polyangiaceae bacterium]
MSVVVDPEISSSGPSSSQGPTSGSGPSPYASGNVIAERYELVRLLGQGGIGQVWLAKSQTLHNEVALKLFIRGGPSDPGDGAERLLAEARAAAALEHPAIVRVFDYGETERGDPFPPQRPSSPPPCPRPRRPRWPRAPSRRSPSRSTEVAWTGATVLVP